VGSVSAWFVTIAFLVCSLALIAVFRWAPDFSTALTASLPEGSVTDAWILPSPPRDPTEFTFLSSVDIVVHRSSGLCSLRAQLPSIRTIDSTLLLDLRPPLSWRSPSFVPQALCGSEQWTVATDNDGTSAAVWSRSHGAQWQLLRPALPAAHTGSAARVWCAVAQDADAVLVGTASGNSAMISFYHGESV
jgi:hypothetical protein